MDWNEIDIKYKCDIKLNTIIMRLLVHNLLMCNVSKCEKNNYPL